MKIERTILSEHANIRLIPEIMFGIRRLYVQSKSMFVDFNSGVYRPVLVSHPKASAEKNRS